MHFFWPLFLAAPGVLFSQDLINVQDSSHRKVTWPGEDGMLHLMKVSPLFSEASSFIIGGNIKLQHRTAN
jgi:hypothetical protein